MVVTSAEVSVKALPHASVAVATTNTGIAGQLIVVGAGSTPITGAVISCTFIVCDAVDTLLHPSVAVHVLVTLYEPAHAPLVVRSAEVNVNALAHSSVAVATANTGVAGQLIVVGAGKVPITGATTSCTFMVCEAIDALPHASVAVHVLVTLYDPAHAPFVVTSAEVRVTTPPQASVAEAVAKTGVAGQLIVDGAGNEAMTGAVISCTTTNFVHTELHPLASVTVNVSVYDVLHPEEAIAVTD